MKTIQGTHKLRHSSSLFSGSACLYDCLSKKVGTVSKRGFRGCVPPCSCFLTENDGHTFFIKCFGARHTRQVLEWAICVHCENYSLKKNFRLGWLSSWLKGAGPLHLVVRDRSLSWQPDGSNHGDPRWIWRKRWVSPFSLGLSAGSPVSSPCGSSQCDFYPEAAGKSTCCLHLWGDGPVRLSESYTELLEVVTRAVEKVKIEWPAEEESLWGRLDERFLTRG